jgi:hypothetical protein
LAVTAEFMRSKRSENEEHRDINLCWGDYNVAVVSIYFSRYITTHRHGGNSM